LGEDADRFAEGTLRLLGEAPARARVQAQGSNRRFPGRHAGRCRFHAELALNIWIGLMCGRRWSTPAADPRARPPRPAASMRAFLPRNHITNMVQQFMAEQVLFYDRYPCFRGTLALDDRGIAADQDYRRRHAPRSERRNQSQAIEARQLLIGDQADAVVKVRILEYAVPTGIGADFEPVDFQCKLQRAEDGLVLVNDDDERSWQGGLPVMAHRWQASGHRTLEFLHQVT